MMALELRSIPLDLIMPRPDNREVDPSWVEAIAVSVSEVGLISPIRVRGLISGDRTYQIISGGHRFAAHQLLQRSHIDALVGEMTDDEAELQSLDENLIRNELSDLERAIALRTRKILHERLHPETAHGKAKKAKKNNDDGKDAMLSSFASFSKAAARRTGLSERTIQRAVQLVEGIDPQALVLIRGTDMADNQAQLMRLARLPADEQVAVATAIATGRAKNIAAARVTLGLVAPVERDPQQEIFTRLVDLWSRANAKTRRRFLDHEELAEAPKAARRSKASDEQVVPMAGAR